MDPLPVELFSIVYIFPLKMVVRPKHVGITPIALIYQKTNILNNNGSVASRVVFHCIYFPPEDGRTTETCSG
jgi:hypothetical protein